MRKLKKIPVQRAVGMALFHDLTRILPGIFKGVGFKKGHIIHEEDISELLKMGKEKVFVQEIRPGYLHEDEAGLRLGKALAGTGVTLTGPSEGKVSLICAQRGLLKIQIKTLSRINALKDLIVSTRHQNTVVQLGDLLAATRIIPLLIPERRIQKVEDLVRQQGPVVWVKPFASKKVGAVVTGSEIYKGLIPSGFETWVGQKIRDMGISLMGQVVVPDSRKEISQAVIDLVKKDADIIVITGGLSVDPDDVTPQGIREAGASVVFYGAPVLPGAMFLLARLGKTVIMGLPACVYFHHTTIFDLILPLILADEPVTSRNINQMGHGGLCLNCEVCRYPVCPFGKGGF